MIKIKLFDLNLGQVVARFYLMMFVAIAIGFTGHYILMPFVAGIIGASAILGINFSFNTSEDSNASKKIFQLDTNKKMKKAS